MKVCNAAMSSYTYATKAQKILSSRGYSCEVKRIENVSASGCGFSIVIYGDCKQATAVLDSYSIPYSNLRSGEG